MDNVVLADRKYKPIANFLYFHHCSTDIKIYSSGFPCNLCNKYMSKQFRYIFNDKQILSCCLRCDIDLDIACKRFNFKKYYPLLMLLSRQLLTDYLPVGYYIPEIPMKIVNDVIKLNTTFDFSGKIKK